MNRYQNKWMLGCFLVVALGACHEAKYLGPGQYLYDKSIIRIQDSGFISARQKKDLVAEMKTLLRPEPNKKFLGFRFKLWVYNVVGEPKGKGLKYFLRNKVGEAPVYASLSAFEKNRAVLTNRLENRGFFKDTVILDTVSHSRTMTAIYTARTGPQYSIRDVSFPSDSSALTREIRNAAKNSRLKPGDPYNLDVIKDERLRIDNRLKQTGYYYFLPDYLLVRVDSTVGNHTVSMQVSLKAATPERATEPYSIHTVNLYVDYDPLVDSGISNTMVNKFHGCSIFDPGKKFRPVVFSRELVYQPGDLYNRKNQDLALSRLVSLGVFKFVRVSYDEPDSSSRKLDVFYNLTTTQKKSIRFEISGLTTSNDANGGLVSVTWRNRNLLRGAELFTASVYGGFEKQYLGSGQYTNITKLGSDLNLFVPKVIAPFTFQANNAYVSKTRINLGYEFYERTDQYTLNSFKTGFGYVWKRQAQMEEQLTVLGINLVNPTNITPEFQAQLDTNVTLARSIERQFIIGPIYNFTYNSQLKPSKRANNFYFNGNLDF
ncbi:MAG TPA: POTRA domain-containing protein, partial [Puia sp.]|nr:POTRA domain-containing protein [Puia sp.]